METTRAEEIEKYIQEQTGELESDLKIKGETERQIKSE